MYLKGRKVEKLDAYASRGCCCILYTLKKFWNDMHLTMRSNSIEDPKPAPVGSPAREVERATIKQFG